MARLRLLSPKPLKRLWYPPPKYVLKKLVSARKFNNVLISSKDERIFDISCSFLSIVSSS